MTNPKRYPYWLPYLLPYGIFLLVILVAEEIPGASYPAYAIRTLLAAVLLVLFWRAGDYPELDLKPSLLGIGAGLAGFALWVYPEDALAWLPKLGESSFDPHGAGENWFVPLVALRLSGAVLVVPVFEELFLRSFLLRWADTAADEREDFASIPIGRYRLFSFLVVVGATAVTHDRWLRGGLYSALLCLVLYREKRMGPVIWAHAITNLALGIHVLHHEAWVFW